MPVLLFTPCCHEVDQVSNRFEWPITTGYT
jgi:hypothetical protein